MPRFLRSAFALALVVIAGAGSAASREELAVRTSQAAIGRDAGAWRMVDQHGRPVGLEELTDKPLVVSFIYTGCFQVCPATTQFLKGAVAEARRAVGPGRFRVASIGFNQPFLLPQALAQFARKQGVADDDWLFLAPREQDVAPLLERFGLSVERSAGGFEHIVQASLVDTRGVIVRQIYGERFTLPMLVDPLKAILAGDAARETSLENIWTKVKLYCTVYDPTTGKYKLDYSLFFELFAGVTTLGALAWFMLSSLRRR